MSKRKIFDMGRGSHQADAFAYQIHGIDMGKFSNETEKQLRDVLRQMNEGIMRGMGMGLSGLGPEVIFPTAESLIPASHSAQEQEILNLKSQVRVLEEHRRMKDQELEYAYRQVRGLTLENQQLQMEKATAFGAARAIREVPGIILKHLRFIIFACHPDRNPGRREAGEVTAALLKLRKGQ